MVTLTDSSILAGAVYRPEFVMVPIAGAPPFTPSTIQMVLFSDAGVSAA